MAEEANVGCIIHHTVFLYSVFLLTLRSLSLQEVLQYMSLTHALSPIIKEVIGGTDGETTVGETKRVRGCQGVRESEGVRKSKALEAIKLALVANFIAVLGNITRQ